MIAHLKELSEGRIVAKVKPGWDVVARGPIWTFQIKPGSALTTGKFNLFNMSIQGNTFPVTLDCSSDTGVRVCHNLREFESAVEEALGSPAGRAAINSALTAEAMAALR